MYKDYGYSDEGFYDDEPIDRGVGPDQVYICRVLYEAAIAFNTPFAWDQFYSTCGQAEDYAWYEDVPPPEPTPDLPLPK